MESILCLLNNFNHSLSVLSRTRRIRFMSNGKRVVNVTSGADVTSGLYSCTQRPNVGACTTVLHRYYEVLLNADDVAENRYEFFLFKCYKWTDQRVIKRDPGSDISSVIKVCMVRSF